MFTRRLDIVAEWIAAQPEPTDEECELEPKKSQLRDSKKKLRASRPATSAIEAYAKAVAAAKSP